MKRITDEIVSWFIKEVFKNLTERRLLFPKNVSMREQIMNIKREFNRQFKTKKNDEEMLIDDDDFSFH